MKVLVTGASGYAAGHLIRRLLANGFKVRGLLRPTSLRPHNSDGLELILGDLMVPESLKPAMDGVDAVVHLAALRAAARPNVLERTNVKGTRNIARAAADAGVERFVFVSSLAAQGPSPFGSPHIEAGDEAPLVGYGESKLQAEAALQSIDGLEAVILRPARIYGPGDPDSGRWLAMARLGVLPIRKSFELAFIHVDDLCQGIELALRVPTPSPKPYFLSDGEVYAMKDVGALLVDAVGRRMVLKVPISEGLLRLGAPALSRLGLVARANPNSARILTDLAASSWACLPTRAQQELGFEPKVDFLEAFPRLLQGRDGHAPL